MSRRLRARGLRTLYLRRATKIEDDEGVIVDGYSEPIPFQARVNPAGGKLTVEMYGQRANNMLTIYNNNPSIVINKGDYICVNVGSTAKPDYKVIGYRPWEVGVFDLEENHG